MDLTVAGTVKDLRDVQNSKAYSPMEVTEEGMVIDVREFAP